MEVLFVLGGLESRKSTKIDFCKFFCQTGRFIYFFLVSGRRRWTKLCPWTSTSTSSGGTIDRLRHPTISTGTSVVVKYIYKATSIGAFCLVSFFSPKDVATKYITYYIGITYKCSSQNGLLLRREGNRRKIRD